MNAQQLRSRATVSTPTTQRQSGRRWPGGRGPATGETPTPRPGRLLSLDAFRGFIMLMLAANAFGFYHLCQLPASAPVWKYLDYDAFQVVALHLNHPEWISNFRAQYADWWGLRLGVFFWDLIQPAFMFMVGMAMPFSYARRQAVGHSPTRRTAHAAWRALVLVLLGVMLSSTRATQTNWSLVNVLSQIGLGYLFVYLLLGRPFWAQMAAFVLILVGYWGFFYGYTAPEDYDYASVEASANCVLEGRFSHWSKNANAGHQVDLKLLNMFPRPKGDEFRYNRGGYLTLNFVPSIATMLLGVFCGQLLMSRRRWFEKLGVLLIAGIGCLALGALAGEYLCPVVKRIWTPSWVLFSGGYVILMLALFYFIFDLCRLRWIALPLVVIGMNSIAMYMMGQLMRGWAAKQMAIHFTGTLQRLCGVEMLADDMFGRLVGPTSAMIVFWLIVIYMYRHKYFVRI